MKWVFFFFFFKQKTAYEISVRDWSSDVCSSDLREALTPETAYVITQMLRGVVERGTGVAAKALGRPIAAKTGTTNDYSNAWFIGFTPRLVTGVWVGHDRPRSLGRDETG